MVISPFVYQTHSSTFKSCMKDFGDSKDESIRLILANKERCDEHVYNALEGKAKAIESQP